MLGLGDVEQLFLVLFLLYVSECVVALRGEAARFFTGRFTAWSDVPGDWPKTEGRRLVFANPLPAAETYLSDPFPFAFDGEVLLVPSGDDESPQGGYESLEIADLLPVSAIECSVVSGGRRLVTLSNKTAAAFVAEQVELLRSADPTEREETATALLGRMWSVEAARVRLSRWRVHSRSIRLSGATLTVAFLVSGPVLFCLAPPTPVVIQAVVLAVSAVSWGWTAVRACFIAPEFLPRGGSTTPYRLIAFFSPASAMRLYDAIGRNVLIGFEPAVVAMVTGRAEAPESTVASWLRDAVHPSHRPAVDPRDKRGIKALAWFQDTYAALALEAVSAVEGDPRQLTMPGTVFWGSQSYCPRCLRQFTAATAECAWCEKAAVPFCRERESGW